MLCMVNPSGPTPWPLFFYKVLGIELRNMLGKCSSTDLFSSPGFISYIGWVIFDGWEFGLPWRISPLSAWQKCVAHWLFFRFSWLRSISLLMLYLCSSFICWECWVFQLQLHLCIYPFSCVRVSCFMQFVDDIFYVLNGLKFTLQNCLSIGMFRPSTLK